MLDKPGGMLYNEINKHGGKGTVDNLNYNDQSIVLPRRCEFRVSVEDLTLRVLTTSASYNEPAPITGSSGHPHAYCEVFVCVNSEAVLMTEKEKSVLRRGMIAIVPPGVSHVCLSTDRNGWDSIGLLVSRRRVRGCENLYDQIAGFLYGSSIRIFKDEESIAGRLYSISSGIENGRLRAPLTILMDLLALREASCLPASQKAPSDKGNYDINRLAQLEQLINVYYSSNITLEKAAMELFISKSQLTRLVRQHYGMTFHKLISSYRVNAAAKLLCDTDLPADKISAIVGFRTKSCFYKAFMEKFDATPNAFRKAYPTRNPAMNAD